MAACLSRSEMEKLKEWLGVSSCPFARKQLFVLKKLVDRLLESTNPEKGVNLLEFVTEDLGVEGQNWVQKVGRKFVLKSSFYKLRDPINKNLEKANPLGNPSHKVHVAAESWHLQWDDSAAKKQPKSAVEGSRKPSLDEYLESAKAVYIVAPSQTGAKGELAPLAVLQFMQFLQVIPAAANKEIRHWCLPTELRYDMTQRGLYFCLGNAEINPFTRMVLENYVGQSSENPIQVVEDGEFQYALFLSASFDDCIHLLHKWRSRALEPLQSRPAQVA
jgi:hypothetical protein